MKEEIEKEEPWKEMDAEGIITFKRILSILYSYYNMIWEPKSISETWEFRKELIIAPNARVFVKKFGEYEYLIRGEIADGKNIKTDEWIHIDGIQEERDGFSDSKNLTNPVFNIPCLTDIYLNHSKVAEIDNP
ncbi:hypothetical protein LEP1GSC050_4158 [Leptospira broomii serovar Hurstbridge str. 5399]|uniref:Uncharacterized protein n=1 Tax=Leptospira broomii serovar Hurstbridge str. 5399 TaxID=1049789 RepID=T0F8Q0_9LEPT|nr:hypothetical protein [Leptospira broomii]EQA43882.1 hypothetical protein LEP1GSC050_4158 [Leptospira broomii serovar Hurstbridge str. 5399]